MSAHHHRFDELRHHDCVRAARAAAAGAEIHLVGGALRDVYLRLRTPDIDLVVRGEGPPLPLGSPTRSARGSFCSVARDSLPTGSCVAT